MSFKKRASKSFAIALVGVTISTPMLKTVYAIDVGNNLQKLEAKLGEENNNIEGPQSYIHQNIIEEDENQVKFETEVNISLNRDDYNSDDEYLQALYNELDSIEIKKTKEARAYIGQTRTDTVKISNSTILTINGIAGSSAKINFIKKLVLKLVSVSLLTTVGQFMAVCTLIAGINTLSGYKGFAVDIKSKYGKHKAYDTDQWVEYLGWGVISRKGYRYK